jgi:hypothetical protein
MTHQYGNSGNNVVIWRVGNIPEQGTSLDIKVDIWHPAVGLRCGHPPMHLSQLKTWAISLIETPSGQELCRPWYIFYEIFIEITPHRVFSWHKCLGGFLHLKPAAGCQISTLTFDFFLWRGGSINISWKIYQGRQSSCHLGFKSKILSRSLTDLNAWVGFRTSNPQQGVKYQLWYPVKYHALGYSLLYK